jgi:hypothetical protein
MPEFLETLRDRNDVVLVKLRNGAVEKIDVHRQQGAGSREGGARKATATRFLKT